MDFPRHVHQAGVSQIVASDDAYVAALHDGWFADPVAVTVQKADEIWVVYTADSLATAIAEGWTVLEQVDPEPVVAHDAPIVDAPVRARRGK
jgi:hypothetical protein